jgi:hypothetical protein
VGNWPHCARVAKHCEVQQQWDGNGTAEVGRKRGGRAERWDGREVVRQRGGTAERWVSGEIGTKGQFGSSILFIKGRALEHEAMEQ